jgi:hypothetical protein
MRVDRLAAVTCVAAFLSACGGRGGTSPMLPSTSNSSQGRSSSQVTVTQSVLDPVPASSAEQVTIKEYSVPNFPTSGGIAVTKDHAVWWESPSQPSGVTLVRMLGASVKAVPIPTSPAGTLTTGFTMASTSDGRAWAAVRSPMGFGDTLLYYAATGSSQASPSEGYDTVVTLENGLSFGPLGEGPNENSVWYVGIPSGPDQRGVYPTQTQFSYIPQTGVGQPSFPFDVQGDFSTVATGPDADIWLGGFTAWVNPSAPTPTPTAFGFDRFTPQGTFISTVLSPRNLSGMADAVAGPDGAMWFTDPQDNLIGRMTASGGLTTYPIPTADSGANIIVVGGDGALWFTETNASKVGRITTEGQIAEYALPTAASIPGQIVGSSSPGCGNNELWLSEGGKVAQIIIKP